MREGLATKLIHRSGQLESSAGLSYAEPSPGFHTGFYVWGGGGGGTLFWDSKHMCAKQNLCNLHPSRGVWGHAPLEIFLKK